MTIEVFEPVDPYTIAGTGPYNIGHPYGDNDEFVVSVFDGTNYIQLDDALWSISPESSDTQGDLTLDAATATTYAGNTMYIVRRTLPEQGWEGINGEREKGLEVQLDYLTMTVQDVQGQLDKGLFGLGASSGIPVVMVAGRVPIVSPDGSQLIAGPTADQITEAQGYAADAETAQGLSEDARDDSVVAQGLSEDARDASVVAQGLSEDARDGSVVAQGLSEDARDASVVAQGLSEDARDASGVAQGLSEDARDASVVAQGLSEDARDGSVVAQGLSEDARDASVVAQGLSEDARDAGVIASTLAQQWAEEVEDTEVSPGQFSALHHAAKAAAFAQAAQLFDPALYLPKAGGAMTGLLELPAGGLLVGSGQLEVDANGHVSLSNQPRVVVDFGGGNSYTSMAQDTLPLDNVLFQTGDNYNVSTYQWTCPVDGWYRANIRLLSNDTGLNPTYEVKLYLNGGVFGRYFTSARNLSESILVECSANDTLHWHLHTGGVEIYTGTGNNLRYSHASFELVT